MTTMTLALALTGGAAALESDGPEGQVFEATGVATYGDWVRYTGQTATITFDGGGNVTVSGITDAMGEDPFTGAWVEFSNGRIRVDLDIFWLDPDAAGEGAPECYSWPDYPIGEPIEDVGGEWGSEGTCWTGGDVSQRWNIRRVE
ncbi:MAG: hypothetical protein JXQ94_02210 [Maricaulis maris]